MKTLTGIILLFLLNSAISISESSYEKAMKDALKELSISSSIDDFSMVINQFERISDAKKDNWLPAYYIAYTRVMMAAIEQELQKKDTYLDAAQLSLDEIEKMEHDATELMALQGFLYMIRMSVDPARGAELGQKCAMILNQAYMTNNKNPRAVLMLGQFNYGTAQYMGTDTSEACEMFDTVLSLMEESRGKESSMFLPNWGETLALSMKNQCQN